MNVKGEHKDKKINLQKVGLSIVLLTAVTSFSAGFLLREDSIGGARFDFFNFHWPAIERFSTMSWGTALVGIVGIANNPLLYVIASLLPLHGDQKIYHVMTVVVGLSTWPLLSWAYYRRYSKYGIDALWASFGASTILISPTFRSSAFWGTTDYLPLVFCAITSILLSKFQDSEGREARAIGPFTLILLAAVSACAFYTRQFYAFLPVFAAWMVLTRTRTSPFLLFGIFFLSALPEMYLVYLWKGVTPPNAHADFYPAMINVLRAGGIVSLLSAPVIAGCIRRRSLGDVLPKWWGSRSTIVAIAGLLAFIMALRPAEWPELGGGIIFKAGLRMGGPGTPLILTACYLGLVGAILFSMSSVSNALLTGAYLVPFFVADYTYQHYLEPSLTVALFLFADTQTARIIFTKRVMVYNFIFTALILAVGIVYYDLSITQPRPHVRLRTGQPVSQYAGGECCAGLAGAEPHA